MNMRSIRVFVVGLALVAASTQGDTVHFKDGSSLDGTVVRDTDHHVILQVPGGRMTFPMADVDRIEENAKTGLPEDAGVANCGSLDSGEAEVSPLLELDDVGRRRLREMLDGLLSPEASARDGARQRITRFGASHDVFPYLQGALPYMPDRQSEEVLQALFDLDRARAKPIIEQSTHSPLAKNRAKAMTLLGATHEGGENTDIEVLRLLAQGMLDSSPEVQLAAIQGLQQFDDKRATPVLIRGLECPDRRVQSASLKALNDLWRETGQIGELKTPNQWRMLLDLADEEIQSTIDPESVVPLVEAPAAGDVDYNLAVE